MINLFEEENKDILFIDKITKKYKWYARDQFMVSEKSAEFYLTLTNTFLPKSYRLMLYPHT